jgi:hypothetical protein
MVAISKRSMPVTYPLPAQTVFGALMQALLQTPLRVKGADPNQGTIWADKGLSLATWGENVTIFVWQPSPGQTSVAVQSSLKFGLVAWGAHDRNFRTVFEALDRMLQFQAPPQGMAPGHQPPPEPPAPGQ